jgi:hypothetical protein
LDVETDCERWEEAQRQDADALRARAEKAEAERDELRCRVEYLAHVFTMKESTVAEAGRKALIDSGFVLLYDAIAYACRLVDPSIKGAPLAALDGPTGGSDG